MVLSYRMCLVPVRYKLSYNKNTHKLVFISTQHAVRVSIVVEYTLTTYKGKYLAQLLIKASEVQSRIILRSHGGMQEDMVLMKS